MSEEVVTVPASGIHAQHSVRTTTADGQTLYTLTGVLAPHLQGDSTEWHPRTLRASIPIGGLDSGQKFTASQWAPAVSVAAANADGAPANPGWAIDEFGLANPNVPNDHVTLEVKTAVRDASCLLLRVTYTITMVGSIA